MPKSLGRLEDKPENVISVFKWFGESPATYVMPSRIAELRYANGKTPEGELVDATERFRRLREQVNSSSTAEAREALF